jgi:hypothetical protein
MNWGLANRHCEGEARSNPVCRIFSFLDCFGLRPRNDGGSTRLNDGGWTLHVKH